MMSWCSQEKKLMDVWSVGLSGRKPLFQRDLEGHADRVRTCHEGAAIDLALRVRDDAGQRRAQRSVVLRAHLACQADDLYRRPLDLQALAVQCVQAGVDQAAQGAPHKGVLEALGK